MIPTILVYWNPDEQETGRWVVKLQFKIGEELVIFPEKLGALAFANEIFRNENWVLLTVLNKDYSQDHCASKFKERPLWNYISHLKRNAS